MNLTPELEESRKRIKEYAKGYGLDFFETIFELVEFDELNEAAAYTGFPTRYAHWRFGMEYEELSKGYQWGLQKIYEMVINSDPSYAYLMNSNNIVDQKLVMAHVFGHVDFFKNNLWFSHTNRKMMDEIANHATRISRYVDKYGEETVEEFLDWSLSIENLIDPHSVQIKRRDDKPILHFDDAEEEEQVISKLKSKDYMDRFINPPEFITEQEKQLEMEKLKSRRFPEQPERDILLFLIEYAQRENWQRDVLSMVREESYYFSPQAMTKVLNEGWACATGDSLVVTEKGIMPFKALYESGGNIRVESGLVSGGQRILDFHHESNVPTIRITTRRGLTIEGAHKHRILMGDGQWKCLCDITIGDEVAMNVASNLWASDYVKLDCQLSIDNFQFTGHQLHVGEFLDEEIASLIGYFIGDGHTTKSGIGFTCGSEKYARGLVYRVEEAFGLSAKMQWDESDTGGHWRVYVHSRELKQLFTALGINLSAKAPSKTVPSTILRSPKSVVAAFLRGYFDADAYAGPAGIILSSSSADLIRTVQIMLFNFGILSTQRAQSDGCIHLEIRGLSALRFRDEIGFDWVSKRQALEAYINSHQWHSHAERGNETEKITDEITSIEHGCADVYDITVAQTHAYVANGFINHNSYWHSKIMSEKVLEASEVVDYADHFSGTLAIGPGRINPYKLGYELLKDIEERWNKGKFGKDYEECDDYRALENWDEKLGLGMEKLFEVRKLYNDVTFIDEFLTPEFVRRQKMFTYEYNRRTGMYEIANRSFDEIKKKLLFSLTNMGQPFIYVTDGNYKNRGELYLTHQHEGIDLDLRYSLDTLRNIQRIWGRPVLLETIESETRKLFRYDGEVYTVLT